MLKVNNLQKKYNNFSLDVSFEVKSGQITGVVGQNGAGKSTAFKAILGLIGFEGDITILGKDVKNFTANDKQNIGVVLSDSGFSGYLTVKDIIPILSAMYKTFDRDFFEQKINQFKLPLNKKIKEFSTGMKARLKILTALSHNARLLILDEPTAGLDVVARDELLIMLKDYMAADSDRAVLISSHISSDLENLCDDIYMIHDGKIILHEYTDTLINDYAVLKLDASQYDMLDKQHIIYTKADNDSYDCLTNHKKFYAENYPQLVVENGCIDNVIYTVIKGEKL